MCWEVQPMKKRSIKIRVLSLFMAVLMVVLAIPVIPGIRPEVAEAAGAARVKATVEAKYAFSYQVLNLINQYRVSEGCGQLTMDVDLMEAAMQRSAENAVMATALSKIDHQRPDGTECFTVCIKSQGENIAAGFISPEKVVDAWMNSSGHRANILNSAYQSVGIGCVQADDGLYYFHWTQEFSRVEATTGSKPSDQKRTFSVPVSDEILKALKSKSSSFIQLPASGGTETNGKWVQSAGKWMFRPTGGSFVKSAWKKISGKWYFFNASGYMVTGWNKISSKWYYFASSGEMKTGWLKLSGKWYYLDSSGAMVTGTKTIGGKKYIFLSTGVCKNP